MACCKSVMLWGWAKPIPVHFWSNAFPKDPNILSLANGEWNWVSRVEHVTGDEKYE